MSVDPVIELVFGKKSNEIQLDKLIEAYKKVVELNLYPEKNTSIQKYIGFQEYMQKKGCNTLEDFYSMIRNGGIPQNVMRFFVEEEQFPYGLKSIVLKGYPNIQFPEEITYMSQDPNEEF